MGSIRDSYGNSGSQGYTVDFFNNHQQPREALLASPFFTFYDPIKALTSKGCKVRLLVRLGPITTPTALRAALSNKAVSVRYFTDQSFHAKLYIVDDTALVGSANLTQPGLMSNREVSVVLRKDRDLGFDALPGMFNLFWDYADVLTDEICERYEAAFRTLGTRQDEKEIERQLAKYIQPAAPPTAKVGSEIVSKKRSFLQGLRRKYDEALMPAFYEVAEVFEELGVRRPEFAGGDAEIELGRFLGWMRIARAPGDSWRETSLAGPAERKQRIIRFLGDWATVSDTTAGDMFDADREVGNIEKLRNAMRSPEAIKALAYDDLFDALSSVHAFYDRLRFTFGGLAGLRVEFGKQNRLSAIQDTLIYLLHGPGTALERAYDCIYNEKFRLSGFGEACVMELLGWMDSSRPPINGRTIKALRFLGFDVRD